MTGAIGLRLVILAAGAGLVLVPSHLLIVPAALTALGVLAAAAQPGRVGESVALGGVLLGWLGATGWHTVPSVWRTVAAAALIWVVHVATTLAAFVPLDARIERGVLVTYLRGTLRPLAAAAVLVAVDMVLPRTSGPALLELLGVVAVTVLAVLVVVRVRSTAR